jgi:signal peptidase I
MQLGPERDDLNPSLAGLDYNNPRRVGSTRGARKRVRRLIVIAFVFALVVGIVGHLSVQDFRVTGRSMEPSIMPNQNVLVDTLSYDFISPQRGDVVVFHVPIEPKVTYIKRIIAVPGDRIQIRRGKVWINGRALYEPYTKARPDYTMRTIPGINSDVVPRGEYFVLGDDRPRSNDSHRWGLVPRSDIIGRAVIAVWPLSHFGLLTDPSTERGH